jgi:hypothetical protein
LTKILCPENYHVRWNECKACPAGASNPAGDDASVEDGNTACGADICNAGEHVALDDDGNYVCAPCDTANGWTRQAGDDLVEQASKGETTDCFPRKCLVNQYVTDDHGCADCPAGTINANNDDCTGDSTFEKCKVPPQQQTCAELDETFATNWFKDKGGGKCALSNFPKLNDAGELLWTCSGADPGESAEHNLEFFAVFTYPEAASVCADNFMRVCTLENLRPIASGSGCGYNGRYIWTQDECITEKGQPGHMIGCGNSCNYDPGELCKPDKGDRDAVVAGKVGLRCCQWVD